MPEINIINSNASICENGEGPLFIRTDPGTSATQLLNQLQSTHAIPQPLTIKSVGGVGKSSLTAHMVGRYSCEGSTTFVVGFGSNITQGSTVAWTTAAGTTLSGESADVESLRAKEHFKSELMSALRTEHIEDGMSHPAEDIVQSAFEKSPDAASQWTQSLFVDNYYKRPAITGAILRLLGRLPYSLVGSTGILLTIGGLIHQEVQVRDSAVRALESWGGLSSRIVLENHVNRESVPRLAKYIRQVIIDLSH